MSLCESIDTLSMAYLDDELAGEERRELELHLTECASCRAHVDAERADHETLRAALAAPRAPDLLRARIGRALDAEDRLAERAERRRWTGWLLPGSAMLAAAAAIAVFVGVHPAADTAGPVVQEAQRQTQLSMPLEVQGASTGPWLRQHFAPSLTPPQFSEPGIQLTGARLTAISGHDAARLDYRVDEGQGPFRLTALVVRDVKDDELSAGDEVVVGSRALHVVEAKGQVIVTYVGPDRVGYLFVAPSLSADELVRLVVSSDLIGRAQQGR
jgi:anti-sigma factor RsiW